MISWGIPCVMSTFHQTQRLIFIFDTTTLLNCGWLLVWIHFGWCSFPSCWFSTMKQIKRKSGDSFRVAFTNSGTCKTSFVCFEILRGHVVFERDPFRQALLTLSISLGTKPRLKNKDFFKCSSFFFPNHFIIVAVFWCTSSSSFV